MAGGNTNISVGHIDKFGISIHQLPFSSNRRKHKDEYRRNPHAYRF
jgi:hypothetical protein